MTPATPATPAESLEQLAALETSSRIRYRGRRATVLEVKPGATLFDSTVVLTVFFDDLRAVPTTVVADRENLAAFELLPRPRIYTEEAAA
jgi:hypothetical protein